MSSCTNFLIYFQKKREKISKAKCASVNNCRLLHTYTFKLEAVPTNRRRSWLEIKICGTITHKNSKALKKEQDLEMKTMA